MTAQPERQRQQNYSEHERIRAYPQDNRERTDTGAKQDQHAKQQREQSHHDQKPLVCDRFPETNTRDNFEGPTEDRPQCNQVEQNDGGDRRPSERKYASDDSDHAFNQQRPLLRRHAEESDHVEDAIRQGVGSEQQYEGD
jgi:hypothetical protein